MFERPVIETKTC